MKKKQTEELAFRRQQRMEQLEKRLKENEEKRQKMKELTSPKV